MSPMEGGPPPVPDPTVLTTEQLLREVDRVQKLIDAKIEGSVGTLSARLDGMELVLAEKFQSVRQQFEIIESRRVEQKQDTKTAVDAALQAQKEAVAAQTDASEKANAKTEAATTKSTDQLAETFNTAVDGMRREIADLRERLGKVA